MKLLIISISLLSNVIFAQPDILVCQEVMNATGYNHFLDDVLNIIQPDIWAGADFIDQSANLDIALYYKPEYFTIISTTVIPTAQTSGTRNVIEWVMEHINTGVQFLVYGVHFKAGSDYAERRLIEMTILRNYLNELPEGSHFIVVGDFNIYSNNASSEPGFDMLTSDGSDTDGQLFDPINRIGEWHANVGETDNEFADVHTQSTRSSSIGDGASGGMDDRFDWIFISRAVHESTYDMTYVDETYFAFGNDGNHCNESINSGTNDAVSQSIADALYAASHHLPVVASFYFGGIDTATVEIISVNNLSKRLKIFYPYPNPFNPVTTLFYDLPENAFINITIYDMLGKQVKTLINQTQYAGSRPVIWDATDDYGKPVSAGIYLSISDTG